MSSAKPESAEEKGVMNDSDEEVEAPAVKSEVLGKRKERSDVYVKTVVKKGVAMQIRKGGEVVRPDEDEEHETLLIQFRTEAGEATASPLEIPKHISSTQLTALVNSLLNNEEKMPYSFFLNDDEVVESLQAVVKAQQHSIESVLDIVYRPQALFRVNSVARCTSSLPGHTEAILHVAFSANGKHLASGAGDATVRIWDVNTETPKETLKGHTNWVMAVAWSPCGSMLASGAMDNEVRVWDPVKGERIGKVLRGHTQPITALAWEPMLTSAECVRLASASRDCTIRVWDVKRSTTLITFSGHTKPIHALRWGGAGLLYSGSQDRSIKAWDLKAGKLFRSLEGHAHWVNCLSLNADHALRSGPYDQNGRAPEESKAIQEVCAGKYAKVTGVAGELLVSGSDDMTLHIWDPVKTGKAVTRMTGHQQLVNFVSYSPDGTMIASASFDKSVRLWHGTTGKQLAVFRGHVQSVYQVAWAADSRMLVSSSKDSTIKLWSVAKKKMVEDLPGHADEVFAVDWSPDGERVASGGKDKLLKIWRG